YDRFRDGIEVPLHEAMQIPANDPLLLIPAMAAATTHLGFGVTFSTTYEPPFPFARRMSTLDHLTKGRVGWNIVTSYLPNAARNFGLADEVPHDRRYAVADEYLDVLYKLWEGSWDDDAVVRDHERRIYTDPAKVRAIDHAGEHYRVAGPHLCQPSPQRTPLLYQASGSPAGLEFAARHAEVLFIGGHTQDQVRRNISNTRARLSAHDRPADAIRYVVMAGIVTARTDAQVADKLRDYRALVSAEGALAHSLSALDLTAYDPALTLGEIIDRGDKDAHTVLRRFRREQTVGDALRQMRSLHEDRFFVSGTPDVVCDAIEEWLDHDGIDGINLRQYLSFETARDFVELIVPELRRRGRLAEPDRSAPPLTLRERTFGAGHPRLPPEHFGARYRDPARLHAPADRLRFPERPPA
ncbi:MAG: NtaA/DmoA family FMN-dependent monooxygenase, partial [Gluconacetobacter diazotrophicus]|nr:NtaA/DmoA family FMN-dependent monooxygenase [Gluconacetobacter diazotrophicus]